MKTYAFIDVQNTSITTEKLLGFKIDWSKINIFLKNEWKCDGVYLYTGIDKEDAAFAGEMLLLKSAGCIVRTKNVFSYKNKDKQVDVVCPNCQKKFIQNVDMGFNKKSNCDVDLTVDAMEMADFDREFYIFSGDGDFEYLIRKVIEKGATVHIVSSAKKIRISPKYFTSRFSTKLRRLINESGKPVDFINIDNLKFKIKKDLDK